MNHFSLINDLNKPVSGVCFVFGLRCSAIYFSCIYSIPADKKLTTRASVADFITVLEQLFSCFAEIGHTGYSARHCLDSLIYIQANIDKICLVYLFPRHLLQKFT